MKFAGFVGYCQSQEGTGDRDGIWEDSVIVEKPYYGDVLQYNPRWDPGEDRILDDQRLINKISIVADDYLRTHISDLKYVLWEGTRWKVTAIEVLRPRLILTLGGVYHGATPGTSGSSRESVY